MSRRAIGARVRNPGSGWKNLKPWNHVNFDVSPSVIGRAARCSVGVVLTTSLRWNGRLIAQAVYPAWLLSALGPEGRKASFMSFFKRPGNGNMPVGGSDENTTPTDLAERAPTLGHFLCDPVWPDGEVRQRSTLVVFVEAGIYKACLSDKDSGTSLWGSCKSFDDLLEALEARLTEDQPDWRKARKPKK